MSRPEDLQIIRRRELAALLGVSGMTLHRWESAGDLPARIRLGPNSVGWRASEIAAWMAKRAAEGRAHGVSCCDPGGQDDRHTRA